MEKDRDDHLPAQRPLGVLPGPLDLLGRPLLWLPRLHLRSGAGSPPASREASVRASSMMRAASALPSRIVWSYSASTAVAFSPARRAESRSEAIFCDLLSSAPVILPQTVSRRMRRMMPKVIHSQMTRPGSTPKKRHDRHRPYMTMARMQMTSAMMPTPSTRTAVSSMLVWIFPAASGWRADALHRARRRCGPRPSPTPRTARPAPMAGADEGAELHDCGCQCCQVHIRSPSRTVVSGSPSGTGHCTLHVVFSDGKPDEHRREEREDVRLENGHEQLQGGDGKVHQHRHRADGEGLELQDEKEDQEDRHVPADHVGEKPHDEGDGLGEDPHDLQQQREGHHPARRAVRHEVPPVPEDSLCPHPGDVEHHEGDEPEAQRWSARLPVTAPPSQTASLRPSGRWGAKGGIMPRRFA